MEHFSFFKKSDLRICFEPQNIEQGIMNGEVNIKNKPSLF